MEIFLDNSWESTLVKLFAHYLNLNGSVVKCIDLSESALNLVQKDLISFPNIPCMVTGKDSIFRTAISICMKLAELSYTEEIFFINSDKLQSCQITSWFEQALNASNKDKFLENLNQELSSTTFLIGTHITFADLSVFAFITDDMGKMEDERKYELCNVFRWQRKLLCSFPRPMTQQQITEKKDKKQKKIGTQKPEVSKEEKKVQGKPYKEKPTEGQEQQQQQEKKADKQAKQQEQKAVVKAEKEIKKEEKKQAETKQSEVSKEKSSTSAEIEHATLEEYTQLDIRVGKFQEVWKHPESENLYCEKIELGGEVREIASGLQKFVEITEMDGLCCVAYNLKGRKIANFMSNGMVLCCSNPEKTKIEILRPPEGSVPGERIVLEGHESVFAVEKQAVLNPKKKILEKTFPCIKTDADGFATFNGIKWRTSAGFIKSKAIKSGIIS